MHLFIASRKKPLFSGEVHSLKLPGSIAPFQVLKSHIDFISSLEKGVVTYQTTQGKNVSIQIQKGLLRVTEERVTVLVTF